MSLVVFSGGTGGNSIVAAIQSVSRNNAHWIMPVSDNGGSSAELLRCLGGVSIGDIRSRLVRLIPETDETGELYHIKTLLSYRLPADTKVAKAEWYEIVEGCSSLWQGISHEKAQSIRSFILEVQKKLLMSANSGTSLSFDFSNAAIGNLVLMGMNLFFSSIESAIFIFKAITRIPEMTQVLPVLVDGNDHNIAAQLCDGTVIAGQSEISHPQQADSPCLLSDIANKSLKKNILFTKDAAKIPALHDRIHRLFYINPYGQEMNPGPVANRRAVESILQASTIVFAPGSLYTSIVPLLIPCGVAEAILSRGSRMKIFFLNGNIDRETPGYTAKDFLEAVRLHCSLKNNEFKATKISDICTHLIYLRGPITPYVDETQLRSLGVQCISIPGDKTQAESESPRYSSGNVEAVLKTLLSKQLPLRRSTLSHGGHAVP